MEYKLIMEQMLKEQFKTFGRLKKLQENFKQNTCKYEGEISARKELLSKYYKEFSERDACIETIFTKHKINTADEEYFKQDLAFQCELLYVEMKGELLEDKSQSRAKSDEPSSSTARVKPVPESEIEAKPKEEKTEADKLSEYLSKLNVTPFSGDPMDWEEFGNQFYEKIYHKSDLNTSKKFDALKLLLPVEVFALIKHHCNSESTKNCTLALNLLRLKYSNKKCMLNSVLEKLLKQPSVKRDSPESIFEFLKNTLKYLKDLKTLKVDMSNWDVLLVSVLVQKLDKTTKSEWNLVNWGDKLPTLFGFLTFLNKKQKEKDLSNEIEEFNNDHKGQKVSPWECVCCNGKHPLWKCDKFELMNIDERLTLVQGKEICMVCLSSAHKKLESCPKGFTCRICQSKDHHYLLHKNSKRN